MCVSLHTYDVFVKVRKSCCRRVKNRIPEKRNVISDPIRPVVTSRNTRTENYMSGVMSNLRLAMASKTF